jgi:PAS domain S-box-containing protein
MEGNAANSLFSERVQLKLHENLASLKASNVHMMCVVTFENDSEIVSSISAEQFQNKDLIELLWAKRKEPGFTFANEIEIGKLLPLSSSIGGVFEQDVVLRPYQSVKVANLNSTIWYIQTKQTFLDNSQESLITFLTAQITSLLKKESASDKALFSAVDLFQDIDFLAPFHAILTIDGVVMNMSDTLQACTNWSKGLFTDQFDFVAPFNFEQWCKSNERETARLYFFNNGASQRYKFSAKKNGDFILLVCAPVINQEFPIANYGLTLSSFSKHDYISEFLFLQQTSTKALQDSQNLIGKIAIQNRQLKSAQKEIEAIAKFPEENPNPIMRFDLEGNLLYKNKATTDRIEELFHIENEMLCDLQILNNIQQALKHNGPIEQYVVHKQNAYFSLAIKLVAGEYVNLYITEITDYITALQEKENELSVFSQKLEDQRFFYEYILDNLPADVAVFNLDHTYKYVNPKGIKDPELRAFMIGKTDYDYCNFRGISTEIADKRRLLFNEIITTQDFVVWEDEHITKNGERQVILRRMGPLFDDSGNMTYVVGYGTDITDRKLVEERIFEVNNKLTLRDNFLNRVSDGIQVADEKGRLVYINRAASERLGIDIERMTDYFVWDFEKMIPDKEAWVNHTRELIEKKVYHTETANVNLKTGETHYIEVTVKCESINGNYYFIAASRDITARKIAEQRLLEKSAFQELMIDLSSQFINLPPAEIDLSINRALRRIGQLFDVSRVFVCEYDYTNNVCNCTYEWNSGIQSNYQSALLVKFSEIESWIEIHNKAGVINSTLATQNEISRASHFFSGKKDSGILAVPLMNDQICIGFIAIESENKAKQFTFDEESLLLIFAQMLVNLRNRVENLDKLNKMQNELENINTNLEKIIDEQTASNNNLIQTLYKQDKLALIGEISAGIAHDLNTPLGVIKIGSENIQYSLNKIFSELLVQFDFKFLQRAIDLTQGSSVIMPVGGMQLMREKQVMAEKLAQFEVSSEIGLNELAQAFVNVRIGVQDDELIREVLQLDDPVNFLELIYQLRTTFNFLETMQQASKRSADVVKTLKSYLRVGSDTLAVVNLDESIKTVIQIFTHELKYRYTLNYTVPSNLYVKGYESKLFQLWSNLIKNALEAMPEGGELSIHAESTAKTVVVEISNNGSMIPLELQEKIFEKFFTTKGEQNGTGLGLSIVKKIIDEHQAEIRLSSTIHKTIFRILFQLFD